MEFSDRNNDRNDRNFEQPDDGELEEPCLEEPGVTATGPDRPDINDDQPPNDTGSEYETPGLSPEEMDVAAIEEEVHRWLDDHYELRISEATSGHPSFDEAKEASFGLAVRMARAAQRGDITTVDECVRTYNTLQTADGRSLDSISGFGAYLNAKATTYGSELAYDKIHQELARERDKFADAEIFQPRELRALHATYLDQVTEVFARERFPAEHLIEEYAPTPVLRLAFYLKYARDCRAQGATPERTRQLEVGIADSFMLLPDSNASDTFGFPLLSQLHDDSLRAAVFRRFAEARNAEVASGGSNRISWKQYAEILDGLLVTPPSSMGRECKRIARHYADAADNVAQREGFTSTKIDIAIAKGVTPGEAIALATRLASEDKRSRDERRAPGLTYEVDETLAKYAYRYARVGDFEASQTLLGSITSPYAAVHAMARCMPFAATGHQRTYLQPDSLQRVVHPEIENRWQVFDAVYGGDTGRLESALRVLVSSPEVPYSNPSDRAGPDIIKKDYYDGDILVEAFKHIPPDRALALAKELRGFLPAQPESTNYSEGEVRQSDLRRRLSNILIGLGDIDEIRQKYIAALREERPNTKLTRYLELTLIRPRR